MPVTLDGTASSDPDGVATWTFYLGDGTKIAGASKTAQATWMTAGTYVLRLTGSAPGDTIRPMLHQASCSVQVKTSAYTTTWRQLGTGGDHTCGIHRDGTLWCWGDNSGGHIDPANPAGTILHATQVTTHADWTWLSAGDKATYAIRDGRLWKLDEDQDVPSAANSGPPWRDWVMVSAGARHTCGVRANNSIWCWGANEFGQLGAGNTSPSVQPVQVFSVPSMGWSTVAVGDEHTCATRLTGELFCWGRGLRLGTGDDYVDINIRPLLVSSDAWAYLEVGHLHTFAMKRDQSLWCFGASEVGQCVCGGRKARLRTPFPPSLAGEWLTSNASLYRRGPGKAITSSRRCGAAAATPR